MRFFCPESLTSQPIHALLAFRFGVPHGGIFKEHLPPNFFETAEYVEHPRDADAIILPNNFGSLGDAERAYIQTWANEAEARGIPLYLFSWGDLTDRLQFDPRAYVFRTSVYRRTMGPRDIVVPTLVEDLGARGISMREKKQKPIVSFCGQAGYKTLRQRAKYFLKNIYVTLGRQPERKLGVFWRRAMMCACNRSSLVGTHFIVRHSFSGARKTIELDPARARREFIDSIVESDFVLAPKGDGNYSNRLLEALSLGRIPVVPDTDIVLPLQDKLPYDRILVRVPMSKLADTPRQVREWYDSLTADAWRDRQRLARETFERYLRDDSFFRNHFERCEGRGS